MFFICCFALLGLVRFCWIFRGLCFFFIYLLLLSPSAHFTCILFYLRVLWAVGRLGSERGILKILRNEWYGMGWVKWEKNLLLRFFLVLPLKMWMGDV